MSESETDIEFVSDMEWLHSHDREAALPPEKLARLFALARRGADAAAEIKRLRETLDSAYNERNRLVAFLARLFPSGLKYTAIPGWDEAWHGCVYIDLPTGQASWHYHDREAYLFDGLPPYSGDWDGHSTGLKYLRIARAALKEDGARAALKEDGK